MCESCDNAKDLIAVWMCPCGGLIRRTGEGPTTGGLSNSVGAVCPDCEKHFYLRHDSCDTSTGSESFFVLVCHAGRVVSASGIAHRNAAPAEPDPPAEHTTPHGVVYVAEDEVPL